MAFILVVDDEVSMRLMMQKRLQKDNHQVVMAESTAEAIGILQQRDVDVILTDIVMPGDDGIELLKAVRQRGLATQIIMMTGAPTLDGAAEAVRNGAADYLIKPTPDDVLCRAVEKAAKIKATDDRCKQLEQEKAAYLHDLEDLVAARTKALQASNDQLTAALESVRMTHAKIERQERLNALGQLASGIAHDFNNALMPILGLTDYLLMQIKTDGGSQEQIEILDTVLSAARDAQSVVQRLRGFYSDDAPRAVAPVALRPLVDKVIKQTLTGWLAEGKRIRIINDIGQTPDVSASESQLHQMLINLVINSAHAIDHEGTIRISSACADNAMIHLSVSDDGAGMSPETAARCMEPFFSTKGENGSGLGLAMCCNIARRHGGDITIESREGHGTCVTISLPESRTPKVSKTPPPLIEIPFLRVLVIDDDAASLQVLKRFLEAEGHDVEIFEDAETGLARLAAGTFDLVMTDRAMMEMSGDVVATRAKRIKADMPVILVTGYGDLINARGLEIPGVDLVVSKPITQGRLQSAICTVLQKRTDAPPSPSDHQLTGIPRK